MTKIIDDILANATAVENASWRDFWTQVTECSTILREIAPNVRRPWLMKVIYEIYEKQDGKCSLCSEQVSPPWHIDHIIPFSYGGGNESSNVRIAHPECNMKRGNRGVNPWDLLRYMEDKYMNR
ncbi:MAG: HNH endonuclease signature motif containing protein [Deltaproteobacteria bacterium]